MNFTQDRIIFNKEWFEAIKDLPTDEFALICKAIFNFGFFGEHIELKGILAQLFVLFEPQLLLYFQNNEKPMDNYKTNHRFKNNKANGNVYYNVNLNKNDDDIIPSSLQNDILKECEKIKIFIDNDIVSRFINTGIDPSWLKPPFSFISFVYGYVSEEYKGKPENDLRKLFISAILNWESLRSEYPFWKEKKIKTQKEKDYEEKVAKARGYKPAICQCGVALEGSLLCRQCGGFYEFDNTSLVYKFNERCNSESLSEMFNSLKRGIKSAKGNQEE